MDAHLLRRVYQASAQLLCNARLEKIQSVGDDLFCFRFFTSQGKLQLCLKSGHQGSLLFFTKHPLTLGQDPTAYVMRLRKYLTNQRVISTVCQPFARKIWLLLGGSNYPQKELPWLLLDLREGVSLKFMTAAETPADEIVLWPQTADLTAACEDWRHWPVLTPKLRRTLAKLSPKDAAALLRDLEEGGGDVFLYRSTDTDKISQILAWPIPDAKEKNLKEEISSDILGALEKAGQELVFEETLLAADRAQAQKIAKERKRLAKLAQKLDEEEERLLKMCQAQENALIIQQNLWQIEKQRKVESITLKDYSTDTDKTLVLDPRLSILENMQRFFHTAERGQRGLTFLAKRKAALHEEEQKLTQGLAPKSQNQNKATEPSAQLLPKSVQGFRSSDGFLLLRGRTAQGNLEARKLAKGHDIWLHTAGGPGSHVIIRLAYPGQTIPEQTLCEAGQLAAIKSWQKDAHDAEITFAEIRHIKPMRGAGVGTVRIDKVLTTRQVPLDPKIEERLTPRDGEPN